MRDDPDFHLRGTGRSHRAMEALPKGGAYIIYGHPGYYRELADKLGRDDIVIIAHYSVERFMRGRRFPAVEIDHFVHETLKPEEWNYLLGLAALSRHPPSP